MPGADFAAPPGFRRRFVVTPMAGRVTAAVEDDFHCMAVTLHHDGRTITRAEPVMDRWPWTTCPGAQQVLRVTFEGIALSEAARRGQKQANCTHLYDLAVLAAAHAAEPVPVRYDILVSDPVEGLAGAEIRRDGELVHRLELRDMVVASPPELAGTSLLKLGGWIESLAAGEQEAARLLRWGAILAHGRTIPLPEQSDATKLPPNCFTFQPENSIRAQRIGRIVDFSREPVEPLGHFDGERFERRTAD